MKTEFPRCPTYSGGDVSYTYQAEDRGKFPNLRKFSSISCAWLAYDSSSVQQLDTWEIQPFFQWITLANPNYASMTLCEWCRWIPGECRGIAWGL